MITTKPNTKEAIKMLGHEVENILNPLGYEVVTLELKTKSSTTNTGRTLVLYIDFLNHTNEAKRIGVEDCVVANKAMDELLEKTSLLEGHYTLEVSSPGNRRPLCKTQDYQRFTGRKVRVHTYRSLESKETESPDYWDKNKNQKNFCGKLEGLTPDTKKIKMNIDGTHIKIPIDLVLKAHLEVENEHF